MREPKSLSRTVFGNPILRTPARRLTPDEITSEETQQLIADMRFTLERKKYGVGLAAPQVGVGVALALIAIKPTPLRPNREPFERVIINPETIETHGRRMRRWEGCISLGVGRDLPYAQTMRWRSVTVRYQNEQAEQVTERFDGLAAHVFQHERDHLNGVLFVDRVVDSRTFMAASEFRKRVMPTLKGD